MLGDKLAILATLLISGCVYQDNAPLLFGSATTLGVSAGASAGGQAPELTVGFREARFMSAPTIARDGDTGKPYLLTSTSDPTEQVEKGDEDTFSTYAAFDAKTDTQPSTSIGTVFATGPAARIAACGTAGKHKHCSSGAGGG